MQVLAMEIKDRIEDAPNYKQEGGWNGATLRKAIIVRDGTEEGNDTIDLQFVDDKGNRYVAMITARLLRGVTDQCRIKDKP